MTTEEQRKIEKKALEQFMSGKSLFGKDGVFAPMFKGFIEKAHEAEMDSPLNEQARCSGNKRNGKGKKKIKTGLRLVPHRIAVAVLNQT